MKSFRLLGIRIDQISRDEIRSLIAQKLQSDTFCHIATVNPEFLVEAQKNKRFREILEQTDLNICDGAGIELLGKLLYGEKIERIPGVELAEMICGIAAQEEKSVFFLGGRGVAKASEQKMCSKYKNLQSVGAIDGNPETFEEVKKTQPNVILVAFGAPKQEYWLAEKGSQIPSLRLGIGVGGTFDFWAGKANRAPKILRNIGLEWFWRLATQPSRWRRILNAVVIFPFLSIQEKIRQK
ncbi:WecB/TagA/CpsF family glycosyltransferase [Candidatus Gracilibacteria bacterium]|nr:WecB/TagA/CpsF family glycosyltransferase [Candidatus Gracilibacteria bacterium]MCF7819527.1 WecB/TagA/CpsF family glycosyltransferase [Candidatus Gracilibacteria bacterium]